MRLVYLHICGCADLSVEAGFNMGNTYVTVAMAWEPIGIFLRLWVSLSHASSLSFLNQELTSVNFNSETVAAIGLIG